ncbi:MAG: hypothetical protein J6N93_01865, partial [Clostridia bacterium]|nr:hypothetical protein [Clostridia bacterium]
YTGEEITFIEGAEGYTVSGNKGTKAGDYTVTFTLIDDKNTEWADEFDGEYTYTIEKAKITAPSQGTASYAYTGEEITFIEGAEGYTVSGNKGTNAGNYTVTLTLLDENYDWADGFEGVYVYTIEKMAEKQLAATDFDLNMNLSAVGTGKIAIDLGEEVVAENIAVKVGDVTVSGEDVTLDGTVLSVNAAAFGKIYGENNVKIETTNRDFEVSATFVSKIAKTAEDFKNMALISRAMGQGGLFRLGADIDLQNENLYNVDENLDYRFGVKNHFVANNRNYVNYELFKGVIDGCGHSVSNMFIGDNNYAWIQCMAEGAELKNISFVGFGFQNNCSLVYGYFANNFPTGTPGGLIENVYIATSELAFKGYGSYGAVLGSSDAIMNMTIRNVVVDFTASEADMKTHGVENPANTTNKALGVYENCKIENVAVLGLATRWATSVLIVRKDGVNAKSDGVGEGVYVEYIDGTNNGVLRTRNWNGVMSDMLPSATLEKLNEPNVLSRANLTIDGEKELNVGVENGNLTNDKAVALSLQGAAISGEFKHVIIDGTKVTSATLDGETLTIPALAAAKLYGTKAIDVVFADENGDYNVLAVTATYVSKMIKTTEEFLSIGKISKALNFGGYFKLANDLNIVDENNTAIDIFNNDPEKDAIIGMVKHTVNDAGKTTRVDYAPFVGIIDGNGYTVRNLRVVGDAIAQLGNYSWIKALGNGGVLRNIAINLTYNSNCALIYGDNNASGGLVENVYVNVEYNSAWDTAYNAIFGSSDDMLKTTFRNVVVNFNGRLATADNAHANRKAFAKTNGATFENVALLGVNDTYKNAVMIADGAKSNGNAQGIYVEFTDGTTNGVLRTRNWTSPMTEMLPSSVLEELNKANTIEVKTIDHGDTNLKLTVSGDTVVNSVNGVYNLGETEYGTFKKATIDGAEIAGATLNNGELTLPADKIATIYGDKQIKVLFEKESGDFNQLTVNTTFVSATATTADEFKNMALISRAMGQGGYFKLGANIELDGSNLFNSDVNLDYRFGVVNHFTYAPFVGTIDGCGYTVKNLTITGNNYGWVQYLGKGGTIKNITIDGFTYKDNCALIYGNNSASGGIIENVYVKASYQGNWRHASIFGSSDKMIGTTVKNVVVEFTKASSDKMASSGAENADYKALGLFENSTFENVAILGLANNWNTSVLINNGADIDKVAKSTGVGEGIYVKFVDGTTNGVTLPETWNTTYWTVENGTVSWKAKA